MIRRHAYNPETWEEETQRELVDQIERYGYRNLPGRHRPRRPEQPIPLLRGATPESARGMYWTTDIRTAEQYASRRSSEGYTSRVYRTVVAPEGVIHCTGNIQAEVRVHPEALDELQVVPHRGQRIPGLEVQQTARWLEHRGWEIQTAISRYGLGSKFPGSQRPTLPAGPVRLFRGATSTTRDGLNWTCDRVIAEENAVQCSRDGWEGRLFSATFQPSALFTQQRLNFIVRPHVLEGLVTEELPLSA